MTLLLAVYEFLYEHARCRSNTTSHRHFQRHVREPINAIIAKILNPTLFISFWHLASLLHSTDYLTSPSKARPKTSVIASHGTQYFNCGMHFVMTSFYRFTFHIRLIRLISMTMGSTPSLKSVISVVVKRRSLFLETYKHSEKWKMTK